MTGAKWIPLRDNVLVRREEAAERTPLGIFLPETAREKPKLGTVVAVGAGRRERGEVQEVAVAEGDVVLFRAYAGTEVSINDESLVLVGEDDIVAVVRPE